MKKKLTELEQAVKNVFKVILVNLFLLLAVKSFDFFMSISKFKIWKDNMHYRDVNKKLNNFCHLVKICSVYEELVKIVYMLHYSFSIICFYFLNKNFLNYCFHEKITTLNKDCIDSID